MTARGLLAALAATALLPRVAAAVCAPAASGIFPASGVVGTSVSATIVGSALDGGTVTVFGAAGLTAAVQSSAPAALTVRLDIAPDAAPGERLLFVDTAGGTTGVSFTVNPSGGPIVDAVSPPLLATQGIPLDVAVSGANLAGVTGATVSGSGVSVTATPSGDGTTLALAFTVDAAADLGTHAVTLTAPGGSAVLQLYVQRPPPTVTALHPAAGEVGATVPITITGTNLSGAALVVTTPPGASVGDLALTDVTTPDDSTLTATLTISGTLSPSTEPVLLIVTTESGQTTVEFFVVAPGVPTVTGIEPGAAEPGDTVTVTLHGLHLTGSVVSEVTADLSLANQQVLDDETITVDVTVAPGATTGTDHTLTVTTGSGPATAPFRVLAPGDPFIGAIRPPFGNRGSTITVFIPGVNLGLVVPGTGVQLSGPKITESNAAAVNDGLVRAILDIDPTANVGHRDVTVTLTNAGSVTRSLAFRVNIPGQLPSIDDVTPNLVLPGTTTAMQVTGANLAGGAVLVTGPGATVTNTVVDAGGTLITFDLTLSPDAPAENRAVIVVTENGTARCGIASDPSPPPLLAAKLVKTGALFVVPDPRFRLFVFEFSVGPLFEPGLRIWAIADSDGSLTLTRLDAFDVERAFRELHRGWVRVRAVTPTNRIAESAAETIRR